MIPATKPYVARYGYTTTDRNGDKRDLAESRPVIAWDSDGQALVVNDRGSLIPATVPQGFQYVEEADDRRVVGVIPGGGWQMVWQLGTPDQYVEPVLCWVVCANGDVKPVGVDEDGYSETVDEFHTRPKVYPPNAEIPPAPRDSE
ncbi:MAG TPA: hypothetical protein VF049_00130 [Nocardioidaceae bacterium]